MIVRLIVKKNLKISPLKRPLYLVRFQYTAQNKKYAGILHCKRREYTRKITLKIVQGVKK